MTKPLLDKAEVALEYPDKLYIGTFDRTSQFDAHLDATGLSLNLAPIGLLAEILNEVAESVGRLPAEDVEHRGALTSAAGALHEALCRLAAGPGG
jgi:hypothetical protein